MLWNAEVKTFISDACSGFCFAYAGLSFRITVLSIFFQMRVDFLSARLDQVTFVSVLCTLKYGGDHVGSVFKKNNNPPKNRGEPFLLSSCYCFQ